MNAQLGFPMDLNQINGHVARNIVVERLEVVQRLLNLKYAHLEVTREDSVGKVIASINQLPDDTLALRFTDGTYTAFRYDREDRYFEHPTMSIKQLNAWGLVAEEDMKSLTEAEKAVELLDDKTRAHAHLRAAIRGVGVEAAAAALSQVEHEIYGDDPGRPSQVAGSDAARYGDGYSNIPQSKRD